MHQECTVGETYATPGLVARSKRELFVDFAENDTSKITYSMLFHMDPGSGLGPGAFLVGADASTLFTPSMPGRYSATMLASDAQGATVAVFVWGFTVVARLEFKVVESWNASHEALHAMQSKYALNELASSPDLHLNKSSLFENYAEGDTAKIAYRMDFNSTEDLSSTPAPGEFLVGRNGATLLDPVIKGWFAAQLVAVDAAGHTAVVYTWSFEVLERDTKILSNGPNGQGCNLGRAVDRHFFDSHFTCDCSGLNGVYTGANCEKLTAAPDDAGASAAIIAAMAILVCLLLVVVTLHLWHRRRAALKKTDFEEELQKWIEEGTVSNFNNVLAGENFPREIKRTNVSMVSIHVVVQQTQKVSIKPL